MGDYRYTELSYKITSLISHTCCLGSSGLTLYMGWCGSGAIYMRFLSKYYNKNTFNTFQLSVPVAVNITWDNYATCKAVSFYIRGFIYTGSYSSPTKQMAGLYIWSPTL